MSQHLNIDVLDADGAIRESAEAAGLDRSDFLRKGVLAGGGLLVGGAFFTQYLGTAEASISTKRSKKNDAKSSTTSLTLEFLEAEFYKQGRGHKAYGQSASPSRRSPRSSPSTRPRTSRSSEALGSAAIKSPSSTSATPSRSGAFAQTSQVLEDTGVSAYLGQVGNIHQKGVLSAAGRSPRSKPATAAWIRFINDTRRRHRLRQLRSREGILKGPSPATGFIKYPRRTHAVNLAGPCSGRVPPSS